MVYLPLWARDACRMRELEACAQCAFIAQLYDCVSWGFFSSGPGMSSEPAGNEIKRLAPDAARYVRNEAQLGPLLCWGEFFPFRGGREPVGGAAPQIFQREKARGFVDSARDVVCAF